MLSPFYKSENWDSDQLRDLPSVLLSKLKEGFEAEPKSLNF